MQAIGVLFRFDRVTGLLPGVKPTDQWVDILKAIPHQYLHRTGA
jgi:hypothetical protein